MTVEPGLAREAQARAILAPGGRLRVGLYPGSPTSLLGDPASGTARGAGHDLGRELARRLGAEFVPVVFARNAELLEAAKAGRVDLVFTNATPARARDLDFTATVLEVEQGYLVNGACGIATAGEVDRVGVRVGVVEASTSQAVLARELAHAAVVVAPTLAAALDLLRAGAADALASNKAILAGLRASLPGSRIVDGAWGLERFALGIPKGREGALPYLERFAAEARSLPAVRDFSPT